MFEYFKKRLRQSLFSEQLNTQVACHEGTSYEFLKITESSGTLENKNDFSKEETKRKYGKNSGN